MASEEMSFENVDGRRMYVGRTTDACLYYKLTYEPSAQVSYKANPSKRMSTQCQMKHVLRIYGV